MTELQSLKPYSNKTKCPYIRRPENECTCICFKLKYMIKKCTGGAGMCLTSVT